MATSGHFSLGAPTNPLQPTSTDTAGAVDLRQVEGASQRRRQSQPISWGKLRSDEWLRDFVGASALDMTPLGEAQTVALSVACDLYDPETPWGALGIAYDPTSPRWTWKVPLPPPALSMVAHEKSDYDIFAKLKAAASVMPEDVKRMPNRLREDLTTCSDDILRILRDISRVASIDSGITPKSESNSDSSSVPTSEDRESDRVPLVQNLESRVAPSKTNKKTSRKSVAAADDEPEFKAIRKSNGERSRQPAISSPTGPRDTVIRVLRCCPVEVPSILHMILDKTGDKLDPRMVEQYAGHVDKLCDMHLEKYRHLKASMAHARASLSCPGTPQTTEPLLYIAHPQTPHISPPSQRLFDEPHTRRGSSQIRPPGLPGSPAEYSVRKKKTAPGNIHRVARIPKAIGRSKVRPVPSMIRDSQYRKQMLQEIQERFARAGTGEQLRTHGEVTNRTVFNLLSVAKQPNALPDRGPVDVHFLTGEEARAMLDAGSPTEPIVTEKEQTFRWQPRLRPIAELFRRMENLDRRVSVQLPSLDRTRDSFESKGLQEVRDRFIGGIIDGSSGSSNGNEADDPWNILDLRSPIPAAVLPQFLTCENCQLLPRLRDEVLNPDRAERDTATRSQWNEWRDVLEWVLLSQGGHNTSPHTDSHGLATWITVQEGLFGYGWLSRPTSEEREKWMANPQGFTGGHWCYLILEPGQTVFFNSGTVHFVFRLRNEHTLALGGHILQWTGIERWLQIVAAQMSNPHITNEDMEWSAPKYVRIVAQLVEMRLRNGRVAEMGGEAAMRRLLALLKEFDDTHMKERPHRGWSRKKKHR